MADSPILLLPVRLETRFVPGPAGTPYQLLVRVYPDDVAVDTHERDLTADEADRGTRFWQEVTGASRDQQVAAWTSLSARFGPQRAAWIARVQKPGTPLGDPVTAGTRAASWTRAPHTYVLPDSWIVCGYDADGRRLFEQAGGPIRGYPTDPDPLPTGPSPSGAISPSRGPGLPPVDDAMLWMVDFGDALARGMAITVPLTAQQRAQLDRVLVFGWRAADATARLHDLFEAHHYTRGLALVPPGTPTSSTGQAPSGFASRDPDPGATMDLETGLPRTLAGGSDGHAAAAALGLGDPVFARVRGADGTEQPRAAAMNAALWSATGGYFLAQMMAGAFAYQDAVVDAVRRHFVDRVRARGPLPTLRIGNQPYGVLPVMPLASWTPADPVDARMVDVIARLRPAWRQSQAQGQTSAAGTSLQQRLVSALATDGVSLEYAARPLLGPGYADYLFQFLRTQGVDAGWWDSQKQAASGIVSLLGLTSDPLVSRALFSEGHFLLDAPLVSPRPLPAGAALSGPDDYVSWLRSGASGYLAIRDRAQLADGRTPLLYLLLRHSALSEYASAAYRYPSPASPTDRLDPELVHVRPGTQQQTVWDRLQVVGAALDQARTSGSTDASLAGFTEFFRALQLLAGVPASSLELLLAETLDLCSFRLDAWCTSFVAKRLAGLRAVSPSGIRVGGYGWVLDLGTPPPAVPSAGFVHAPSAAHAASAAVLRSGYLSHRDASGGSPLAIDLSSEQVRLAEWLLDGVRQGQALGALLGYVFERALHENHLDQYVDRFRAEASSGPLRQARSAWEAAQAVTRTAAATLAQSQQAYASASQNDAAQQQLEAQAKASWEAAQAGLAGLQSLLADAQASFDDLSQAIDDEEARGQFPTGPERTQLARLSARVAHLTSQVAAATTNVGNLQQAYQSQHAARLAAAAAAEAAAADCAAKQQAWNDAAAAEESARQQYLTVQQSVADTYELPQAAVVDTLVTAVETLAAPNVVDGLALDRLWKAGGIGWGTASPTGPALPPADPANPDYAGLTAQLNRLDQAVRAVSDALAAESVYQSVRGNSLRASATLDAVARGQAPPPELEVLRSPRSGVAFVQRLVVLFTGTTPPTSTWPPGLPRAMAEPWLNWWAATLLGDPARVTLTADHIDPATGASVRTQEVHLADLGLAPLDVVYLSASSLDGDGSELMRRLTYLLMRPPWLPDHPTDLTLRLTFARDPGDASHVSFPEALEVARAIRAVMGVRPLAGRDLTPPGAPADGRPDEQELAGRADAARNALQAVQTELARPDANLRAALLDASSFGIPGAIPPPGSTAADDDSVRALAAAVLKEVAARLAQADALTGSGVDVSTQRLQAIFGGDFVVLPRFTPANAADLGPAFAATQSLQGATGQDPATTSLDPETSNVVVGSAGEVLQGAAGHSLGATTWVERMSWVRDGALHLHAALTYGEALVGPLPPYRVAQLPYAAGDRWGGVAPVPGGRVGLVAHVPAGVDLRGDLAGLFVDELVEVIPSAQQATALAFHHEAPVARAPQALLLAVPPTDQPMTADLLEATLLDALDLVERVRPVDPDVLHGTGQLLPALFFAVNPAGDTVSTDFTGAAYHPEGS